MFQSRLPGSREPGVPRVFNPLADFLHKEAAGGIVLLLATVVALVWANGPLGESYEKAWRETLTIGVGDFSITEDLRHWVNDGLMALFFFVVGLEIKRELVVGELRDPRAASLPVLAALGGAVFPAALFLLIVGSGDAAAGWGIPMATDIAFAVGVLALLGSRISSGVKLFLLTLAIVDDVLAISVIAVFYSDEVSAGWLMAALGGLLAVVALRRAGVVRILPYVPLGLFVWLATLESGIHATIAGVALGVLTPARPVGGRAVLEELEHRLHPYTSFGVVPLFALANAGVNLGGGRLAEAAGSRLALAIVVGLVVGKVLGISATTFLALRMRVGVLPEGVARSDVWGVAALGGIGFTVSLFISQLAYDDAALIDTAKVGIFAGSILSGVLGAFLLARRRPAGGSAPAD